MEDYIEENSEEHPAQVARRRGGGSFRMDLVSRRTTDQEVLGSRGQDQEQYQLAMIGREATPSGLRALPSLEAAEKLSMPHSRRTASLRLFLKLRVCARGAGS